VSEHTTPAQLRAQIAAATRLLVREDILDYSGHISARDPLRPDALYIQKGMSPRATLGPQDILHVRFDGVVSDEAGKPPVELPIHSEIYRARPDVMAIIHSHMERAICFTLMKNVALVPVRARAVRWQSGIPTDPDPSHIKLTSQGQALAATLGPHHAALMRAHGLVLVAESVPALLVDAVHFDENARALLSVLQAGCEPMPLTPAEMEQINRHEMRPFHVKKLWAYYLERGREAGLIPSDWPLALDA
jgi:L-ribulose-5-phosphate 4-epimerase